MKRHTKFPDVTREDWRDLVKTGLRGASFDSLIRQTEDGIRRGPLMSAQDLPPHLAALGRTDLPLSDGRAWQIVAPVCGPELAHANQQILADLKGGASALRISFKAQGENPPIRLETSADIKRLFEGVHTDLITTSFAPNPDKAPALIDAVLGVKAFEAAHLNLGLAPFAMDGAMDERWIKSLLNTAPKHWRVLTASSVKAEDAGATPVQGLALIAAKTADILRRFGPEAANPHLIAELTVNQDSHLNIAKLRAARRIIARIQDSFGLRAAPIPLHAQSSGRMLQSTDSWTNLLRLMSAGFGAVVGGADYILLRPFTDQIGPATPFAHRVSRNMQLLMMEESHLGGVSDPAYGSFWHERLSNDLAQAAWTKFQNIEASGGIDAYISGGGLSADIKAASQARTERGEDILGVSLHPADDLPVPDIRKTPKQNQGGQS